MVKPHVIIFTSLPYNWFCRWIWNFGWCVLISWEKPGIVMQSIWYGMKSSTLEQGMERRKRWPLFFWIYTFYIGSFFKGKRLIKIELKHHYIKLILRKNFIFTLNFKQNLTIATVACILFFFLLIIGKEGGIEYDYLKSNILEERQSGLVKHSWDNGIQN